MTVRIIRGDCLDVLRALAAGSVHCVVTSPPYYGLRDYDVPPTNWPEVTFIPHAGLPSITAPAMTCCHGMEPDPWSYIAHEVLLFREVQRVLCGSGTLCLNIGDSYAASGRGIGDTKSSNKGQVASRDLHDKRVDAGCIGRRWVKPPQGLKPKDLIGIPWMLAFALRADGWFLRQDIIWSKLNPMPESVKDRCTKAHEYLFLLSKRERYYFDSEALAEPLAPASVARLSQRGLQDQAGSARVPGKTNGTMKAVARAKDTDTAARSVGSRPHSLGEFEAANGRIYESRNKRSVWTVATQPFKGAHFATMPPALVQPCILAGCPQGGVVLDPFGGVGTTGLVADRLRRDAILIELNNGYADMARDRIADEAPFLTTVTTEAAA